MKRLFKQTIQAKLLGIIISIVITGTCFGYHHQHRYYRAGLGTCFHYYQRLPTVSSGILPGNRNVNRYFNLKY